MGPFPLRKSGGEKIRMLRERKGWSQETLAEKAYTTRNWVSHIELGYRKVGGKRLIVTPDPKTIQSIVDALQPTFGERRSILESFGLDCPIDLPTDEEIAWACEVFYRELAALRIPAYLLDCGTYFHAWTDSLMKALDFSSDILNYWRGKRLFEAIYGRFPVAHKIMNRKEFEPMMTRALRYVLWPYIEEQWMDDVLKTYHLLDLRKQLGADTEIPARPLVELHLSYPDPPLLKFMVMHEQFIRDDRFRVVYWYPADGITQEFLNQ